MIEIDRKKIADAYAIADTNTKKGLDELVKDTNYYRAPTLDDYTTIRTYEDACKALGEKPLKFENKLIIGELNYGCARSSQRLMDLPPHIVALIELETVSRALWGRKFKPNTNVEDNNWYYYPLFTLYTKKQRNKMSIEERNTILSTLGDNNVGRGFGYLYSSNSSSYSRAHFGFYLCQETEKKATYFGTQFIDLWAEYLKFNFEVQE